MDTIPGAFPAIAPASNGTHLPRVASDLISVRQSLQSRRTSFVKDLMDKLALLTGAYMFLAYLYDCSVLMLILRGAIHWVCEKIVMSSYITNTSESNNAIPMARPTRFESCTEHHYLAVTFYNKCLLCVATLFERHSST